MSARMGFSEKKKMEAYVPGKSFFELPRRYRSNTLSLRAIVFLFLIFHFLVEATASSSSAAAAVSSSSDVFLNFRDEDVGRDFGSHLHKYLRDCGINAFVVDQLERGKDILEKIEQSHIAIVIFSPNYAHSEYCLDELLKIAECRNTTGQTVIPVFYGVDPSDVQDLTGHYAMAQLRTMNESLAEKWGNALKDTANLAGFVSSNLSTDSKLIEDIINHVVKILKPLYPSDSAGDVGLVGIDSRVEKVKSLLNDLEDVSVVGIWGEPDIGKTTLAKATFDQIRSQFNNSCFVRDVREKCEKSTPAAIQNEVSECFGISDSTPRRKLKRNKFILVLDDVSDLSQIKSIMRYKDDMGSGSRIIVTSQDMRLLRKLDAKIYAVEKLHHHEALQLFSLKAFDKKVPEEGYLELSEMAVKFARGLPLALEVLGGNLFKTIDKELEHKLEKFSNDGLSNLEKEKMWDIASCFRRRTEFDESSVEQRGNALKDTTNLLGFVSSNFSDKFQLKEEIIKQALKTLIRLYPNDSAHDGGLAGIDSHVEKVIKSLLRCPDVRVVGIWGEAGIGKTTLARATYNRISSQFDYQCFVGDVKEKCENLTADATQIAILSECLGISADSEMSRKRLLLKKVILVLDDVSDLSQVKSIMRYKDDMGPGSMIIITSRDMHLLKELDAHIHAVEKLNDHEALELFSLHAFHKEVPEEGYLELSERAVKCARGNPLTLKDLGGELFQKSVAEWEDELKKFGCLSESDTKIGNVLKIIASIMAILFGYTLG